ELTEQINKSQEAAKHNLNRAKERSKYYYDQNTINFKPGDRVIIAPAHSSIYQPFLYWMWRTAKHLIYNQLQYCVTVQYLYNYYRHQIIIWLRKNNTDTRSFTPSGTISTDGTCNVKDPNVVTLMALGMT
ncbi:hypothetical protein V1478_005095, partial [Vespula squamosa]